MVTGAHRMEESQAKILLVDESRFFLTIEKQFLRNIPVTLLEAQSAAQTIAFCQAEKPQLIYLAQEITGMPGTQCCLQIKSDPALRHIPIVMICEPGEEKDCLLAGCDAVLLKPLDRHRFLEIGRSFLAGPARCPGAWAECDTEPAALSGGYSSIFFRAP